MILFKNYIKKFSDIVTGDRALVGGKNASLGALINDLAGIRVPSGFAVTTDAYRFFMRSHNLDSYSDTVIRTINFDNIASLNEASQTIRAAIHAAPFPDEIRQAIIQAYRELSELYGQDWCDVAVRSSATTEDREDASFAGQQDTFLGIKGEEEVLAACKKCISSLFTARALSYRKEFVADSEEIALSVGVQKMVRSDKATAGVAFSLETETGFGGVVTMSSSYGLGELIVQGAIIPDEFYVHKERLKNGYIPILQKKIGSKAEKLVYNVHLDDVIKESVDRFDREKFSITDDQVLDIARTVISIEDYYSKRAGTKTPVDIEWAYDGIDGHLYIVQARPETVHSRVTKNNQCVYQLEAGEHKPLLTGTSIGKKIAHGRVRVLATPEDRHSFNDGDILVTHMTDPDWMPLLKKAAGIVTDSGGRTCHAAIVSRELGIPALVATHHATSMLKDGDVVTLDCSQGIVGYVYRGTLPFSKNKVTLNFNKVPAAVMINCGDPNRAFEQALLPVAGVGLARLEFIIASMIGIHPLATIHENVLDEETKKNIQERSRGYTSPREFFVHTLASSIGMIVGAFHPRPVIVRLSDFKTNEYRELVGGKYFEHVEENPMLGFRGASRYISTKFGPAFELECEAIIRARSLMGFKEMRIMVPFVRTLVEAQKTLDVLASFGLERGKDGLEIYMMVELPSNAILAHDFAKLFDGFSLGSNDMTQLTLGIDRDSGILATLFDERDPAVKALLLQAIKAGRSAGIPVGICGQAPSDYPELAQELIKAGLTSVSLNSDSLIGFTKVFE